jgi:hypothetical protein
MTTHLGAVPPELAGKVVTADDPRYRLLRSTYTRVKSPAAVLLPESAPEIAAGLRFAQDQG